MSKSTKLVLLLILVIAAFSSGRFVGRSATEFTDSEIAVIEAVRKVKPAVVGLKTYRGMNAQTPIQVATGIIFRPDGYILTNAHVLRGANRVSVVASDGKRYEAALVAPSDEYDLAVLKIDAKNLPVATFGDSSKLELGQTAIAIGNPLSFGWTVTQGVVSALNRQVTARRVTYEHLIQTDAAINPGNSGGPLVASNGQVIGINTLVFENPNINVQGLGFAIPSNTVKAVANQMFTSSRSFRLNQRVRLGLSTYDLTQELAMQENLPVVRGVVVDSVEPGSPAAKARIVRGDVLTKVDTLTITNTEELMHYIQGRPPGSILTFEVWRGGLKGTMRVKLEGNSP